MPGGEPLVSLEGVERDYRSLRPLRVRRLDLRAGEAIAVIGLDRAAAEVLVNLITAATLPDTGRITVFGRDTRSIADAHSWMRALDNFGILSERVLLLEEMTVEQNLTLPLSLDLEDADDQVRARVRAVAEEVGLGGSTMTSAAAHLSPAARLRLRLAKALITEPRVLLAEHPNAAVAADEVATLAADLSRIISRRALSALILTADRTFARAAAHRVLTLQPASGELSATAGWRQWFGG
jgi:ABC-type methionine transport system ATPase subunit